MIRWQIGVVILIVLLANIGNNNNYKWRVAGVGRKSGVSTLLLPLRNTRQANCECGKLTKKIDDERLVKVKIAGGRLPWLAELVTTFDDNDLDEFQLCFGTVVSLQTVIFPASCIDTTALKKPKIKFLSIDNRTEAIREISSIKIHPNYRRKYDNDIAIVKLKNPIDFNRTKVVPICLPIPSKRYPIKHPPEKGTLGIDETMMKLNDKAGLADSEESGNDPNRMKHCRNPYHPCDNLPCPPCPGSTTTTTMAPSRAKAKPPEFVLEHHVTRTWFNKKGAGYEYIQHFGRFGGVLRLNATNCSSLFPEMLRSKVVCIQQKVIKDIAKQNEKFFSQLSLGMLYMVSNTTLVKGKPQAVTTKYYLEGMRAPGSSGGIPLLDSREDAVALLKIDDYVNWIRANSHAGHFCQM